jgi:hypothetical protein
MKQHTKLSEKQEHVAGHQSQRQDAKEFLNAEELLRFDAAQAVVPQEIAQRLKSSAAQVCPPPSRPWWKNIFCR